MPEISVASARLLTLKLSFACELAEVRTAVQAAHDFLKDQCWDANSLMSFDLALVEGCNNAVKYTDSIGRQKQVCLEVCSEPAQVEFRIHDHTPGFDWPQKIELPDPDSESGRGIFLMSSLMDHITYFRGPEGNMLVMRKARPPQNQPASVPVESPDQYIRKLQDNERVIGEMVEELSSCYESLSAIFRYSTEHGKTDDLKEFAQRLLADLLQIVSAEWFILRLTPKGESRLNVFAISEPALELEPLFFSENGKTTASIEMDAATTRQRVWFGSNGAPLTDPQLSKIKPGSAGLVHPILLGGQLMGTLTMGRSTTPEELHGGLVFTAGQTNVINTFADFLAIQIANARFQEEQFHRRLVTHELEIANNIQRSLLLTTLPQLPGLSLSAFCRSAHEVGGDFYDVLKVNDHSSLLIIADVMGKGIPAAMFAAMLRTLLRAAPEYNNSPAALLTRVNRLLYPELSGVDMFITAQLAFIDAKAGTLTTASAGHCPLALASPQGIKTLSPEGMPLGILQDTSFQDETVELPANCRVLLYTDGLTEALSAKGEHFGQKRLMDWLKSTTGTPQTADQLREALARELESYQANTSLNDDQTFLIMSG